MGETWPHREKMHSPALAQNTAGKSAKLLELFNSVKAIGDGLHTGIDESRRSFGGRENWPNVSPASGCEVVPILGLKSLTDSIGPGQVLRPGTHTKRDKELGGNRRANHL